MNRLIKIFNSIITIVSIINISVTAQTAEEFHHRRQAVIEKMDSNNILIVRSVKSQSMFSQPRTGGIFYYLTGINEPNAFLILSGGKTNPYPPSGTGRILPETANEILFINPVNPSRANWDAPGLGIEGAKEKMGFQVVKPSDEFNEYFGQLLMDNPGVIYIDYDKSSSLTDPLTEDEQIFKQARDKGARFIIGSPSELIASLLVIKSDAELDLLRRAVDITAKAHQVAMRSVKPGIYEYQLQGIIEYVYKMNGAMGLGFPCIIGSGINSVVLHWMKNSGMMENGDVVVVDIGAEYGMYWADITRTIPVNGTFSSRQKEVYNIVLKANQEAINMIKPGIEFSDIVTKAEEVLADGMLSLGLIKDKNDFRKYYYHGLGHHIGLINARSASPGKLESGMVLTIEPGIYIREEKLGIRIEDDVLVTETGHEVLSRSVPKTVEEVEKIMKERGIDYEEVIIER